MLTKILSYLCILSLFVALIVNFQRIQLGISLCNYDSEWVSYSISFLLILVALTSLFLDVLNIRIPLIGRKLWVIFIWLDAFFIVFYVLFIDDLFFEPFEREKNILNIVNSTSDLNKCFENANMDVVLNCYVCSVDSNCDNIYPNVDDLYGFLDAKDMNCLLDSLIKKENFLGLIDVQLVFRIPDSNLNISKRAVDIIKNEPDPCIRELWMLTLSERHVIEYDFKNICHIKKFESIKPTANELNAYWTFEHDFESVVKSSSFEKFKIKNTIIRKSYLRRRSSDFNFVNYNPRSPI